MLGESLQFALFDHEWQLETSSYHPVPENIKEVMQNNITSTNLAHVATETVTIVDVNNSGFIASLHLYCKNDKTFRLFSHCLE